MKTTTLNKIREYSLCKPSWEKLLTSLNKTKADDEEITFDYLYETLGFDDTLWCLRTLDLKTIQWIALKIAQSAQHLMKDQRSIDCLDVIESFLNGEATRDELTAAACAAARAADATARAACAAAYATARAADAAACATARAAYATAYAARVAARAAAAFVDDDAAAYAAYAAACATADAADDAAYATAYATAYAAARAADAAYVTDDADDVFVNVMKIVLRELNK